MGLLEKFALVALRVSLGLLFLYAGITKVLDSSWSAEGYLKSAKTFPELFQWFAAPGNIEWVNDAFTRLNGYTKDEFIKIFGSTHFRLYFSVYAIISS